MEGAILVNLIEKYLAGKASLDEMNYIDKWYESLDSQGGLCVPDSLALKQLLPQRFTDLKQKLGIV